MERAAKPTDLHEYNTVNESVAAETGKTITQLFKMPGGRFECWEYEPQTRTEMATMEITTSAESHEHRNV
jgi:hypothetical protein